MHKDTLVIDIETKNTFADVGGQQNLVNLDASLVGVYSYKEDKYLAVREGNFQGLANRLQNAALIVGFSSNRFDLPILNKYFNFNLLSVPSFDILDEIELSFGRRISLDLLAKANLGVGKTGQGLDAIRYYKAGDWDSLEKYCLHDVKVTKELYDLAKRQGYLMIPEKWSDRLNKVHLNVRDAVLDSPNTLF